MISTLLMTMMVGQVPLVPLQRFPDETDILRGADSRPNVYLTLDTSCSMGGGAQTTSCSFYSAATSLNRMDMLKAALTGCTSSSDGILDQWATRVNFAVRSFGNGSTPLRQDFGGTLAQLETAILGLPISGGTPFAQGYANSVNHMRGSFTYDSANPFAATNNTRQCRQNYIVMMSDGVGNGGNGALNWGVPGAVQAVADAGTSFTSNPFAPCSRAGTPWADCAAERLFDNGTGLPIDAMPLVDGTQAIRTYTIGFNAPIQAENLMREMANQGDADFTDAQNYTQLNQAFTDIITSIVARSGIAFEQSTVQNDGLFSGNTAYTTSFRPVDRGPWYGNAKRFCLLPPSVALDNQQCLFMYDPAQNLVSNPNPVDEFAVNAGVAASAAAGTETLLAGAGRRIWQLMGASTASDPVPATNPLSFRNLITYNPGTPGYLPLDGSNFGSTFSQSESWTTNACEHFKLLNKLHGYTDQVADCANATSNVAARAPVSFDEWPMGDTVHGGNALLRYDADCDTPGNCLMVAPGNDGILHQFDTADGTETQGIVPGHLWRPNGPALHQMKDLMNQPTLTEGRRFLYDGDLVLYHTDDNGDGVIDAGETARLITSLGRGGYAYIMWDVSNPATVSINSTTYRAITNSINPNPPMELMVETAGSFKNLKETWAAPKIARYRDYRSGVSPRPTYDVGVIPSGHVRARDLPLDPNVAGFTVAVPPVPPVPDTKGAPSNRTCGAFGLPGYICDLAIPPQLAPFSGSCTTLNPAGCLPLGCSTVTPAACFAGSPTITDLSTFTPATSCSDTVVQPSAAPFPFNTFPINIAWSLATGGVTPTNPPCYDWEGWTTLLSASGINFAGAGIDVIRGPYAFNDGQYQGVSYRLRFSDVDLEPGDTIEILDGSQNVVQTITAGGPVTSQWVNDTRFFIRFTTDGVMDTNPNGGLGFSIASVDYVRSALPAAAGNSGDHKPTLWVVDLNRWNAPGAPNTYVDTPATGDQDAAVLIRFTSDCEGIDNTKCIDATTPSTPSGDTSALAFMTCPISMRPEVYDEGGFMRAWYVGDECGQIFRGRVDPATGDWDVRRLLTLNQRNAGTGAVVLGANSKDYRKLFRQLELVLSNCTGDRAIGVYFGSGNLQRPAAFDNLLGTVSSFTNLTEPTERNVVGVVWDRFTPPPGSGYDLNDLDNITLSPRTTPTGGAGSVGWIIELGDREKMLRDPLVFDGVAYFKTYTPTKQAVECVSAEGKSRTFALNNCDGYPANDGGDGYDETDRSTPLQDSSIGGELLLVAPKDSPAKVLDADPSGGQISTSNNNFAWKIFLYRTKIVAPN